MKAMRRRCRRWAVENRQQLPSVHGEYYYSPDSLSSGIVAMKSEYGRAFRIMPPAEH
ncbi:hypothetical protein KCP69_11450 [Salmonella enterica subsp. enterica]|nr:hypothetical protein KCP69_11450 [Salmonella enterica subsp. enterica]